MASVYSYMVEVVLTVFMTTLHLLLSMMWDQIGRGTL